MSKSCQVCAAWITGAKYCGPCALKPRAVPWQQLWVAFGYTGWQREAIIRMKFHADLQALQQLSTRAVKQARQEFVHKPEARLVALGMHWRRAWERGYNQTELMAQSMAQQLGLVYLPGACQRVLYAPKQHRLARSQRCRDLSGHFKGCRRQVRAKYCIVIDDVITTTSTMRAACQALLDAGAHRVDAWALARS